MLNIDFRAFRMEYALDAALSVYRSDPNLSLVHVVKSSEEYGKLKNRMPSPKRFMEPLARVVDVGLGWGRSFFSSNSALLTATPRSMASALADESIFN
jgi:hypothetical protein